MRTEDLAMDDRFKQALIDKGILELYPPQAETVEKGILTGDNFVVAVPTASGKTLIAMFAIFSALQRNPGRKAIYLAPLRALASEKFEEFREFAQLMDLKVAISTGDLDETSNWLARSDIIIATNEKFDSLIRHEAPWLNSIGVIVSDEVHLINDSTRGPVLEVVLTLIRRNLPDAQLIALSATINNANEIAEWLDAHLILSDWRPIKLQEGVWCEGQTQFADGNVVEMGDSKDKEGYVSLALDIVREDGQALVFANTRKSAVTSADKIGKKLKKILSQDDLNKLQDLSNQILTTGEKTALSEKLAQLISTGSAFHHAGLISPHRKLVENGFKDRIIKVISSTPSLAAGVNLPGRRVIIRTITRYSMQFGSTPIPVMEYKQMAGRAGRPQYDPYGQAILLARNYNEVSELMERYIKSETEEIYSQLGNERALRGHLLSFINSEYVTGMETAREIFANTFFGFQNGGDLDRLEDDIRKALELLIQAKLISKKEPYMVTPFGKRTTELYLDPYSAKKIKEGLERAKDDESLDNILYLQLLASTPDIRNYNMRKDDFQMLYDLATEYTEEWLEDPEEYQSDFGFDLFFSTLKTAYVTNLWLNEASEEKILSDTGVSPGDLQNMLSTMEWLIHSGIEITKIFKWKNHEKSLTSILKRLKYGINEELLPLVEIPGIGRVRARALFNANYRTIEEIRALPVAQLAKIEGFGPKLAQNLKEALETGKFKEPNVQESSSKSNKSEEIDEKGSQSSLESFFG